MEHFGGTREHLGRFVVRNREYGLKNENSYWRQYNPVHLTLQEYLATRPISEPIGIYDCDIPVQGAAAFILTSAEIARDITERPAFVRGVAVSPEFYSDVGYPDTFESQIDAGRRMGDHLYQIAEVGPADVSVANLYDGYSANVPFWADALRLSGDGQGLQWIANPTIPLNTSGGNLGNGRMHGVPHLMDGAMQVMGRSGERQVQNTRISLVAIGGTHHAGGVIFGTDG
jgi:acetyl-CoA acetyltransferase